MNAITPVTAAQPPVGLPRTNEPAPDFTALTGLFAVDWTFATRML
jgi:hypothetical protein